MAFGVRVDGSNLNAKLKKTLSTDSTDELVKKKKNKSESGCEEEDRD